MTFFFLNAMYLLTRLIVMTFSRPCRIQTSLDNGITCKQDIQWSWLFISMVWLYHSLWTNTTVLCHFAGIMSHYSNLDTDSEYPGFRFQILLPFPEKTDLIMPALCWQYLQMSLQKCSCKEIHEDAKYLVLHSSGWD